MGLFDKLNDVIGSLGKEKKVERGFLDGIMDMFKSDGINGVVERFKNRGLGDIVSSWIGKGSNMPISLDQIKDVIGVDRLKALAEKAGVSENDSSGKLRDLLPDIIDKITPDGVLDHDDE